MKKLILLANCLVMIQSIQAQINWSANVGGGMTSFENIFSDYPWPRYEAGSMFQAGTSISSLFGKETMVGWEVGLNLVTPSYTWIPEDENGPGDGTAWDYENKQNQRNWYIQLPVSLTFNMFEGTGFLLGARLNRRISNLDSDYYFLPKWIPAAHLGIFTQINPRIRLDVTAFVDIPERVELTPSYAKGMREVGGSLNVRYTLK